MMSYFFPFGLSAPRRRNRALLVLASILVSSCRSDPSPPPPKATAVAAAPLAEAAAVADPLAEAAALVVRGDLAGARPLFDRSSAPRAARFDPTPEPIADGVSLIHLAFSKDGQS